MDFSSNAFVSWLLGLKKKIHERGGLVRKTLKKPNYRFRYFVVT